MARFEVVEDAPKGRYELVPDMPQQSVQKFQGASAMERLMALPAGVNKAAYTNLAGLPVDTVANVIDLGKAAIGAPYTAITGKVAPEWLQIGDRKDVVGSSDWISRKINAGADKLGVQSPINNPRPEDMASRVLYSTGLLGGSSIIPDPRAKISGTQQLVNIGIGSTGGLAAGIVGEKFPEFAGVAGMLPSVAIASGSSAVRSAVRGGEAGRKKMEQRITDLKNGGVNEPSVGLAADNNLVMGLENLLSQTPGSVGLYAKAKANMIDGMKAKADTIRDDISRTHGPVETGEAIQKDLKGAFKDRIGATYGLLNDRVESAVGANSPVPVNESIAKSGLLTTPTAGAESTSTNFINPRIKKINNDLTADAGGTPAQTVKSTVLGPDGRPAFQTTIPATQPQGVPFAALKELRTKIGKEAQSNAIMGTPEQADFKQLYGAMSQDMKNAVTLADIKRGVLPAAGGSATTALNRANTYYRRGMDRADELNSLANRSTPEGSFSAVSNSLNAGPTVYQRLRGAVTPETRKKIVATVIDEMGMAKAGQQGADGDTWSPSSFLTNYNKMDGKSRTELFKRLPSGERYAENLRDIAKASEMLGDSSKIWANPSGTAPALTARGAGYVLTVGAFFNPVLAGGTAGGLALANQTSKRLLLDPKFTTWLAKAPKVNPRDIQRHAQRLVQTANLTKDKQFQHDVGDYLRSVEYGLNNQVTNEDGATD